MGELETAFEKLIGRQPTDADVQRLYRAKDALGLGNNDALWLLLIALDYHQSLYEQIPAQMKQASMEVLNEFRATADAIAKASAEAAKADLAKAVSTAAHKVADHVAAKKKLQWGVGVIAALVVFGCVTLFLGYHAGVGAAFKDVTDVQSAARWESSGEMLSRRLIWTVPYALGDDGSDLAVVRASDAKWLNSHEGRQAREWGEWLSALVDAGLLSERMPDRSSCQPGTVMGHEWQELWSEDGKARYCSVWQGHVLIQMK